MLSCFLILVLDYEIFLHLFGGALFGYFYYMKPTTMHVLFMYVDQIFTYLERYGLTENGHGYAAGRDSSNSLLPNLFLFLFKRICYLISWWYFWLLPLLGDQICFPCVFSSLSLFLIASMCLFLYFNGSIAFVHICLFIYVRDMVIC